MTNMEISFTDFRVQIMDMDKEFDLCNKLHEYAKIIEPYLSDECRKNLGKNEQGKMKIYDYYKSDKGEEKKRPMYSDLDSNLLLLSFRDNGFLSRFELKPLEFQNKIYSADGGKINSILCKPTITIYRIGILVLRVDIVLPKAFASKHLKDIDLSYISYELPKEEPYNIINKDRKGDPVTNLSQFFSALFFIIVTNFEKCLSINAAEYIRFTRIRCIKGDGINEHMLIDKYGVNIINHIIIRGGVFIQISDYDAYFALVERGKNYSDSYKSYDDNQMLEKCRLVFEYVFAMVDAIAYIKGKIPSVAEDIYEKRHIIQMLNDQSTFAKFERYYVRLKMFSEAIHAQQKYMVELKGSMAIDYRFNNIDNYINHFGNTINQHIQKMVYKNSNKMNIMMLIMTGALVIIALLTLAGMFMI